MRLPYSFASTNFVLFFALPVFAQVNVTLDDADVAITYSAGWRAEVGGAREFGRSLHLSEDASATASFVFHGTALYLLSPLFPPSSNAGMQVAIDGQAPSFVNLTDNTVQPAVTIQFPSSSFVFSAAETTPSSSQSPVPSAHAITDILGSETRRSQVLFAVEDLGDGPHSVVISKPDGAEVVVLDAIIVTTTDNQTAVALQPASPNLTTSPIPTKETLTADKVDATPNLAAAPPPATTSLTTPSNPFNAQSLPLGQSTLSHPQSTSSSSSNNLFPTANLYKNLPNNVGTNPSGSSAVADPETTEPAQTGGLSSTTQRTIIIGAAVGGVALVLVAIAWFVLMRRRRMRELRKTEWAMKWNQSMGKPESPFAPRVNAPSPPPRAGPPGAGYPRPGSPQQQHRPVQGSKYAPPSATLAASNTPPPPASGDLNARKRSPLATQQPIIASAPSPAAPPPEPQSFAYGFPVPPPSANVTGLSVPPTPYTSTPSPGFTARTIATTTTSSSAVSSPTPSSPMPSPYLDSPKSTTYSPSAYSNSTFSHSQTGSSRPLVSPSPFSPVPMTPAPNTPLPLTPLPPVTPGTPWSTTKRESASSTYSFSSTVESQIGYGWTHSNTGSNAGSSSSKNAFEALAMPSLVGIHPFSAAAMELEEGPSSSSASSSRQKQPQPKTRTNTAKKAVRVTAFAPALSEKAALAAIERAREEAEAQGEDPESTAGVVDTRFSAAPAYREKDAAQLFRPQTANAGARSTATKSQASEVTVAPPVYEP
ncbi:hypothetical protein MKEN_00712100 [Mycena kentingensis (nom. inval.)]|nr:hypothetical protein MKEN_00712100 [Mycena kentingensis (nom. inval.)]